MSETVGVDALAPSMKLAVAPPIVAWSVKTTSQVLEAPGCTEPAKSQPIVLPVRLRSAVVGCVPRLGGNGGGDGNSGEKPTLVSALSQLLIVMRCTASVPVTSKRYANSLPTSTLFGLSDQTCQKSVPARPPLENALDPESSNDVPPKPVGSGGPNVPGRTGGPWALEQPATARGRTAQRISLSVLTTPSPGS